MLTGRQKRFLRARANTLKTASQIGLEGLSAGVIGQIQNDLESRELVKVAVLRTSPLNAEDAAALAARNTNAEVVQIIGRKFVLFKKSAEKPSIELPD